MQNKRPLLLFAAVYNQLEMQRLMMLVMLTSPKL